MAYVRTGVKKLQMPVLAKFFNELFKNAQQIITEMKAIIRNLWTFLNKSMSQVEYFHRKKYGVPVKKLNLTRIKTVSQVTCRKPMLIRKIIR